MRVRRKKRRSSKPAPTDAPITNGTILWGAKAIGRAISRSSTQTNHLLAIGAIECARKKGAFWCCDAEALRKEFAGETNSKEINAKIT